MFFTVRTLAPFCDITTHHHTTQKGLLSFEEGLTHLYDGDEKTCFLNCPEDSLYIKVDVTDTGRLMWFVSVKTEHTELSYHLMSDISFLPEIISQLKDVLAEKAISFEERGKYEEPNIYKLSMSIVNSYQDYKEVNVGLVNANVFVHRLVKFWDTEIVDFQNHIINMANTNSDDSFEVLPLGEFFELRVRRTKGITFFDAEMRDLEMPQSAIHIQGLLNRVNWDGREWTFPE